MATTLRSLLDNLRADEYQSVLIVVLLADVHGAESTFVREQISLVNKEFKTAVDDGILEVSTHLNA